MIAVAPRPVSPAEVQSRFQNVLTDMVDANARLNAISNDRKYPAHSWVERFKNISAALDDARMGLNDLAPDARRLYLPLATIEAAFGS